MWGTHCSDSPLFWDVWIMCLANFCAIVYLRCKAKIASNKEGNYIGFAKLTEILTNCWHTNRHTRGRNAREQPEHRRRDKEKHKPTGITYLSFYKLLVL